MEPHLDIVVGNEHANTSVSSRNTPDILISICVWWPDSGLLGLLHSLARQSYPGRFLHVCVSYLDNDIRVVRELQKIQTAYEGRFKGIDLCYARKR